MGKSIEENLAGESRLVAAVEWVAAELRPYKTVLDIGCGYARIASSFCEAGYDYTGIDVAPAAIEAACLREPRGHFIQGSALEIGLEKKFDLVCVLYVFVHFVDDEDWLALLRRLSHRIHNGGSLLIADTFPVSKQRPSKHVCLRPLARYETVLEPLGLYRDNTFRERLAVSWNLGGSPPSLELFRR